MSLFYERCMLLCEGLDRLAYAEFEGSVELDEVVDGSTKEEAILWLLNDKGVRAYDMVTLSEGPLVRGKPTVLLISQGEGLAEEVLCSWSARAILGVMKFRLLKPLI